jgi:hypothetical protein
MQQDVVFTVDQKAEMYKSIRLRMEQRGARELARVFKSKDFIPFYEVGDRVLVRRPPTSRHKADHELWGAVAEIIEVKQNYLYKIRYISNGFLVEEVPGTVPRRLKHHRSVATRNRETVFEHSLTLFAQGSATSETDNQSGGHSGRARTQEYPSFRGEQIVRRRRSRQAHCQRRDTRGTCTLGRLPLLGLDMGISVSFSIARSKSPSLKCCLQ